MDHIYNKINGDYLVSRYGKYFHMLESLCCNMVGPFRHFKCVSKVLSIPYIGCINPSHMKMDPTPLHAVFFVKDCCYRTHKCGRKKFLLACAAFLQK